MSNKRVISEEIAINNFHDFLTKWQRKPEELQNIKKGYPDVIDAICEDRLSFDENQSPTLKLSTIINPDGEFKWDVVTFKTRLKRSTKSDLASGLKIETDTMKYGLRLVACIISKSIAEIDMLSERDYDTINQLSSVFVSGGH